MVTEAVRLRVIRAILGWDGKTFAEVLDVQPATITNWERGRSTPNSTNRKVLSRILSDHHIAIRPDGFPVPNE